MFAICDQFLAQFAVETKEFGANRQTHFLINKKAHLAVNTVVVWSCRFKDVGRHVVQHRIFDADNFFCDSPDRYYSFFSGHTSQAFASAAVVCSFHANMPLLGNGPENHIPCVTAMVGAAATGFLRIAGDMHYLSDVLTGMGVGLATGFLLPWLLHFGPHNQSSDEDDGGDDVAWTFMPTPNARLCPT